MKMEETPCQWKPKDWERYANELVSMDHKLRNESYQRIPDRNGDCGLEGVADSGDGYQSYADQDSNSSEDRIKKQKSKIYEDLKKLNKYKEFWAKYFGEKKLKRWTLLVPTFEDKEVAVYAKQQARTLKKLNLPFIDKSFDAFVKSDLDYSAAKMILRDPILPTRDGTQIHDTDIELLKETRPEFVEKLDKKLGKAMGGRDKVDQNQYRDDLLRWYLRSENFKAELERNYPPLWEILKELIATTGNSLKSEEPFDTRIPGTRLTETRREFSNKLKEELKYISSSDREDISWGTLTLWLGICPLDFPGAPDD